MPVRFLFWVLWRGEGGGGRPWEMFHPGAAPAAFRGGSPLASQTPSLPGLLPKLSQFLTSPTHEPAILLCFLSFHADEINSDAPVCARPQPLCPWWGHLFSTLFGVCVKVGVCLWVPLPVWASACWQGRWWCNCRHSTDEAHFSYTC